MEKTPDAHRDDAQKFPFPSGGLDSGKVKPKRSLQLFPAETGAVTFWELNP